MKKNNLEGKIKINEFIKNDIILKIFYYIYLDLTEDFVLKYQLLKQVIAIFLNIIFRNIVCIT